VGKLSIRQTLFGAFLVVLCLMVAVGAAGWQGVRAIESQSKHLFEGTVASTVHLNAAQNALWELRFGIGNFMTGDAKKRAEIRAKEDGWHEAVETNMAAFTDAERTAAERELLVTWSEAFGNYMEARPRWFELYSSGKIAEAAEWRANQTNKWGTVAVATLAELIQTQQALDNAKKDSLGSYRSRTEIVLLVTLGVALLISVAAAGYLVSRIRRPLARTVEALQHVADGDLATRLEIKTQDEMGELARALNTTMDRIRDALQAFGHSAGRLHDSSRSLTTVSSAIMAGSDRTTQEATAVTVSADEVSRNIQAVAAGAEELGQSIQDISGNATDAAQVASGAVQSASSANTMVAKLGDSSAEIGDVLKVITSIAEQTNLLALNATIEAARAGEAGKGFAVVASEVKDLAQETARATEDISRRVQTIQGDTAGAVHAISEITTIISRINDYQGTIASAVEEQTATTNEMRRLAHQAAAGADQIRTSIQLVSDSASSARVNVTSAEQAATDLAAMSDQLQGLVAQFRI
jgi:methyl-accepting chemotaxis protein